MRKLKMTLTIALAGIVVAGLGLRLAVPRISGKSVAAGIVTSTDGVSALAPCPDTPNCAVDAFPITAPANDAIETLAGMIFNESGTEIVSQHQRYLHATFTSKIMGYIDDMEFLVSDDEKTVQVRSASRLGKSDLGANTKRIERLRSLIDGKL